jgi:hypothetical protein
MSCHATCCGLGLISEKFCALVWDGITSPQNNKESREVQAQRFHEKCIGPGLVEFVAIVVSLLHTVNGGRIFY